MHIKCCSRTCEIPSTPYFIIQVKYQLPLILTVLLHVDLINGKCLYQVIVTLYFLNDVVDTKIDNHVIIARFEE